MKSPCKGCERRTVHPNCHGTCEEYKAYATQQNERYKRVMQESEITGYIKAANERRMNKRR